MCNTYSRRNRCLSTSRKRYQKERQIGPETEGEMLLSVPFYTGLFRYLLTCVSFAFVWVLPSSDDCFLDVSAF